MLYLNDTSLPNKDRYVFEQIQAYHILKYDKNTVL